ncbi:MAG: hypothetical protein O7I93_02510 [Gemmatimonadetes bacterium]|nr:hypothetical protein [Gemmatimonadota bacterium]
MVARQLLGITRPDDDRLADHLIRERRRKTRLDGSVDGALQDTAWSAWALLRLGCTKGHAGLDRMIGFLLSRQDQPGRFGEGCSERRHPIANCMHFMSGFFSPGPVDRAIAPLALPTQAVILTEFGARFAVSCIALRTVLRAGEDQRGAVVAHIESLFHLVDGWQQQSQFPDSLDLVFTTLGALGLAPLEYRERVEKTADLIIGLQNAEGTWGGTSIFHALDGMMAIRSDAAQRAIGRALPHVLALQRASGAFDDAESDELALIALRAVRGQGIVRAPARTVSARRSPAASN